MIYPLRPLIFLVYENTNRASKDFTPAMFTSSILQEWWCNVEIKYQKLILVVWLETWNTQNAAFHNETISQLFTMKLLHSF